MLSVSTLDEDLAFNRADRISACGRIILALLILAAAHFDPPDALASADHVVWLLAAYFAAAVIVLAAVWIRPVSARPIGQWDVRIEAEIASEPPADVADDIRLITREAIANAVRHGKAGHIAIQSRSDETSYHLSITDNGGGIGITGPFSAAQLRENGAGPGFILDRVERHHATLVLQTGPGGTSMHMAFPHIRGATR